MADLLVVGGGAAGLMAAYSAAKEGAEVILLEHNEKLGKKIYLTGKGRCNVTNDCTLDEFLREVPRNPRFLYSALSAFSPQDMMALLEDNGLPVTVQRGRRVFPLSEKASDVTRTLEHMLRKQGVQIRLNADVDHLLTEDGRITGLVLKGGERIPASAVILATGGLAYPSTGSTGDGYRMAQACGHTVQKTLPSLTALETTEVWPTHLQGLSLKNTEISAMAGKKVLYREQGEMLFTHFGISGPIVLSMSCHLPEDLSACQVFLNLKPALTPEQLTARLQREFDAAPRRSLAHSLETLLPQRFAALFPEIAGIDGDKTCATVTRAERQLLQETLQHVPLHLHKRRPMAEAIVTRGGITVKEVDPATMQSRLMPGLFFCGEVLDVDAHTGGYNLHIAFSTGFLAGRSAAQMVLQQ